MASTDVVTVVVERTRLDEPWGLRLQGGVDCRLPFSVYKVSRSADRIAIV